MRGVLTFSLVVGVDLATLVSCLTEVAKGVFGALIGPAPVVFFAKNLSSLFV